MLAQSNANLPLKYTKLIGVEGHAQKQTWLIKCALKRGKYRRFSRFKWETGRGAEGGQLWLPVALHSFAVNHP